MTERSATTRLDRYLRREDTVLARSLRALSPKVGQEYRESLTKRKTDIVIATPAALVATPIVAALAIARKLEDGGKAFYVQERYNSQGNLIGLVKIRCMREDADSDLNANLSNAVKYGENRDPRNTPLGSFMRKFELEELPQLWQVVNGDISLVDIRSAPPYVFEHLQEECPEWFEEWRKAYFQGEGGLFSLNSAVSDRKKDDTRRYHYDLLYSRKASLGLDLFVLYRTGLRMVNSLASKVQSSKKK